MARERLDRASRGHRPDATSTIDDTSGSTRRMSPAGSSASSSGQAVAMEGMQVSSRSQARPSVMGLTALTGRAAGRSAAAARRGVRGGRRQESTGATGMETLGHCRQPPRGVSTPLRRGACVTAWPRLPIPATGVRRRGTGETSSRARTTRSSHGQSRSSESNSTYHTLLLKIDDIALLGKEGATVEHAVALRKTVAKMEQFALKACAISASGTGPNAAGDYETDVRMTVLRVTSKSRRRRCVWRSP